MNFVSAILLLAATTNVTEPTDYRTAYQRAMEGDKPLLVLVTAEWCSPCQEMKKTTIPSMLNQNKFKDYYFATVDVDKQQMVARRLIQNRGVPQLIVFEKRGTRWTTRHLLGYQSANKVESFLSNSQHRPTPKAATVALGH